MTHRDYDFSHIIFKGYFLHLSIKYHIMKTIDRIPSLTKITSLFILLFMFAFNGFAQIELEKNSKLIKPEVEITSDMFWHVKAFRPEAQFLKIKAVDKKGKVYDVKAIQNSENSSVLSVKALVEGKHLPIKIIVPKGNDKYFPVMAITNEGKVLAIKAINAEGKFLEVKGVSKTGNIIQLNAITKDNKGYNIIAISPFGEVNAVVGVKMLDATEEAVINGVSIYAHVKAIKQE